MSTSFTPGPWDATHGGPRSNQWTIWADGGVMGDQRVAEMPYELISQAANAHLIKAAPELYEALEVARETIIAMGCPALAAGICDGPLAEARGEA